MITLNTFAAAAWSQFWQVTALIVMIGALTRAFCKHRPHLVYVLWLLVFLKCLTPPFWSSPTGVFSWVQARDVGGPTIADARAHIPMSDRGLFTEQVPPGLVKPSTIVAPAGAAIGDESRVAALAVAGWLIGMLICSGGVVLHWLRFRRTLVRSRLVVDPALITETGSLARRLGLRRKVQIMVVSSPHGPAAFGLWSPTILLPKALADKAPAEREPILAHELVHFRRGDHVFGLLQSLVEIAWWFHPLVWWANRKASRVVEHCCDEEVIAGLGFAPGAYARCLLDVLELRQNLQAVSFAPGMRPAEVTALRLENIMKHANGFRQRTPRWCWAFLALSLAAVLPGGAMVLSQDQPQPETALPATQRDGKEPSAPPPAPAMPMPKTDQTEPKGMRVVEAVRLKHALAADVTAAINDFFAKREQSAKSTDNDRGDRPVVTAEPISNSLFVSAYPKDFGEITRLVNVIDLVQKQIFIETVVCEGEPAPTLREAIDKRTVNVLSRHQILVLENQTAIVNLGHDVEMPAGSGQRRNVGIIMQVTPRRANDKQVPVRLIVELSSINEDRTTYTTQHMETSANIPLERPMRFRGGKTNSGKDLWIQMTATEIVSPEQMETLLNRLRATETSLQESK